MEHVPKLNSSSNVLNDLVNDDITRFADTAALAEIDLITDIDELKYIRRFVETAVNTGRLPYNGVLNAVTMHTDRQIAFLQVQIPYESTARTSGVYDHSVNPYSEYCLPVHPLALTDQQRLEKLFALQAVSPFE